MIPAPFPWVALSLEILLLLYTVMVLVIRHPKVETPISGGTFFYRIPYNGNFSVEPSLMISSTRTSTFGFFGGLLDLLEVKVGMLGDIGLYLATPNHQDHPYTI